jgi:hypothetical protein
MGVRNRKSFMICAICSKKLDIRDTRTLKRRKVSFISHSPKFTLNICPKVLSLSISLHPSP